MTFFDLKRDSPGIWYALQLEAAHAETPQLQQVWRYHLLLHAKFYPCVKCRDHLNTYIASHPPPRNTTAYECSKWLYELRCEINKQSNKPSPPFPEMYNHFREPLNCTEGPCQGAAVTEETHEPPKSHIYRLGEFKAPF